MDRLAAEVGLKSEGCKTGDHAAGVGLVVPDWRDRITREKRDWWAKVTIRGKARRHNRRVKVKANHEILRCRNAFLKTYLYKRRRSRDNKSLPKLKWRMRRWGS